MPDGNPIGLQAGVPATISGLWRFISSLVRFTGQVVVGLDAVPALGAQYSVQASGPSQPIEALYGPSGGHAKRATSPNGSITWNDAILPSSGNGGFVTANAWALDDSGNLQIHKYPGQEGDAIPLLISRGTDAGGSQAVTYWQSVGGGTLGYVSYMGAPWFNGVITTPGITCAAVAERAPLIVPLGDSITAHGNSTAVGSLSYIAWASLFSGGSLAYGGSVATSGYTTAQMVSTLVPLLLSLSPAPGIVPVLGGINDILTSVPLATTKANLTSIWTSLVNSGITPAPCTLLPNDAYSTTNSSTPVLITQLNQWIRSQARAKGWPLVDFFPVLSDPATGGYYQSTFGGALGPYNEDQTHPNDAGAKLMGQALATALVPRLPIWKPFLYATNVADTLSPNGNYCFLTDSNSDGLPDGWTTQSGTVTGGTTYQLLTDGAVVGKFFQVQRGVDDVVVKTSTAPLIVHGGDRVTLNFQFGATITAGGSVSVVATTDAGEVIGGIQSWLVTTATSTFAWTFTCGGISDNNVRVQITAAGASGTQARVGQLTLLNLTTGLMV